MRPKILRLPLGLGRILLTPDKGSAISNVLFNTRLQVAIIREGEIINQRDLGSGLVTTAGVNYMAADMAGGASDISAFTFHGTGIGAVAAVIGDTALGNATGAPARVSGTSTQPGTVNIFRQVATVAYTSTLAITEWGLFSAVTTGTMWDRKTFTAINVVSGDSIQFTYELSIAAGG